MPVYRLADTLNVNSDRFDVIIIDEASQSGPEAMFIRICESDYHRGRRQADKARRVHR